MPGPAVDILRHLGDVERDQRYTSLLPLFAPDAVYYDPFMGPQRGTEEIARFMGHMERIMPKLGVRFDGWEIEADRTVGWARWTMVAPNPDGVEVAVPGQSLVDGVVHDLVDQVVKAPGAGRSDVHARPLSYGFEPFQNRDVLRPVGILGGGFFLSQSMPFRQSIRRPLEFVSIDSRGVPVGLQ